VLIVGIVLCLLGLAQVVMGSNIDPTDKYAWSTNAGWINFAPTHGGVTIDLTTDSVQVVIENQGDAPVIGEFWVQAYIDPAPAPSGVNQLWYDLSDAGMLWGVTSDLLPLSK